MRKATLHSTMFLLKREKVIDMTIRERALHSTMFLLKRGQNNSRIR